MKVEADKTQVSLRIPSDLIASFERIAAALDRDRTWVMLRAFRHYLENEGADILEEARGLEELDRGESFDLDEVLAEGDRIIAETGRAPRRAG
jgi:predicted transcriptional regulator